MVEAELRRAVREQPEDDGPRLVYADWLTEHGDPRGEFITLQCRLVALDPEDEARRPLETRQRELLAAHGTAWTGALAAIPTVVTPYLKRGFVERVIVQEAQVAAHADALFAAEPLLNEIAMLEGSRNRQDPPPLELAPALARLEGVSFATQRYALAALATLDLSRLRRLEVTRSDVDAPALVDAITACALPRLEELGLAGIAIGSAGLRQLAEANKLATVRRLRVFGCGLERATAIAAVPRATALRQLWISGNPLGSDGVRELLTSPHLGEVTEIMLGETGAGDALAHSTLPKLRIVHYGSNVLDAAAGRAIAASAHLDELEELRFTGKMFAETSNAIEGAIAIVSSSRLPRLVALDLDYHDWEERHVELATAIRPGFRRLTLRQNSMGLDAAIALADNPNLASVKTFALASNPIGSAGISMLAKSDYLRPHYLDLSAIEMDHAALADLAESPVLSVVRTLRLADCGFDDEHVRVLMASPLLGHLMRLDLTRNRALTDASAHAIAASPHLLPLTDLNLGQTAVTAAGLAAIRAAGHADRYRYGN